MKYKDVRQTVDNLVAGLPAKERANLADHLTTVYAAEFGSMALDHVGVLDTAATQAHETSDDDIEDLLPEQQKLADQLTSAMAEKFGVSSPDFSVLCTRNDNGSERLTVAYTAGVGISAADLGGDPYSMSSWNGIMKAPKDLFTVEIDGQAFDTRTGMSRDVYNVFISIARANRGPLPDSKALNDMHGTDRTVTWLTGQPKNKIPFGEAPGAYVNQHGMVVVEHIGARYRAYVARFRPAVALPTL